MISNKNNKIRILYERQNTIMKKVIKIINRIKRFFKYRKSVSDNGEYPKFCRDASKDEEIFQTFRGILNI